MSTRRRPGSAFDRFYSVVVLLKGVDGATELIAGVLLLVAPGALEAVALAAADELDEGTSAVSALLASGLHRAGTSLTGGDPALAAFLVVHGVVKLATVHLLLRRLVRWYPAAMAVIAVLLIVQTTGAVISPSVGAWVLAALDVIVLALVALEYRRLRAEGPARGPATAGGAG